ncbi:hypothetical protein DU972_001920 [Vibrio mimicus]|uniref:hypothetical protein n=1 Tax=Vibrio mimicus TaxID=674 RepID=UPI0002BC15FF|nr:hypothetical protein [Vibrio mimicus]ERM61972.1 hypothetical protein P781_04060 [Vibrio mimicus CAIM 1883]ERM62382.1 hypothetical protein P780_04025 [Vibrio mimicus CAIM 1882]EMB48381.1 hypothetical protein D908_19170 [Vibrio mimicus CAIM 602]MBY7675776.1 hypothetical protein [Vibrio mimicus]MBY7727685.1 hypothetical protein [Vibrio mimicus]
MLTKDVSQELEEILNSLSQQGKEPSVALVKARLKTPVPMPAIIATIKSWKNTQRIPKVEVAAINTNNNLEQRIEVLEQTILQLTARIEALEATTKGTQQ